MKNLLLVVLSIILCFTSCKKSQQSTISNVSDPIRTYFGGRIDINGTDLDLDRPYSARIGNSDPIEVRYISSTLLEITVPVWAKNGELEITGNGNTSNVGQVLIARLMMVDDQRKVLREHSIGTGFTMKQIKDFGDLRVDHMIYSRNSNEVVLSLNGDLYDGMRYFYKNRLDDATEVLVDFEAKNIVFDNEGTLYGTIGNELAVLSLENGSKMSTVANFDSSPKSITYFESTNSIRGSWEEVDGGYTTNYSQIIDLTTATVSSKSVQEKDFYEIKSKKDGSYLASVFYEGIIEYSSTDSEIDFPVIADDCCTNFDYSDDWKLLISTVKKYDRILVVQDGQSGLKTEFNEWGRQLVIIDPK
ncbi:hypothetical protein N9B82_04485 [Saprospiraceae bacterium]|nr:hypothetical protein [Saprospiraceae bacterium]